MRELLNLAKSFYNKKKISTTTFNDQQNINSALNCLANFWQYRN